MVGQRWGVPQVAAQPHILFMPHSPHDAPAAQKIPKSLCNRRCCLTLKMFSLANALLFINSFWLLCFFELKLNMNSKYKKENANDVVHHLEYNEKVTLNYSRICIVIYKNWSIKPLLFQILRSVIKRLEL
jgi:hypothetical protein